MISQYTAMRYELQGKSSTFYLQVLRQLLALHLAHVSLVVPEK